MLECSIGTLIIIVLDEATSALEYETENILDQISQYSSNRALIIITHRLNTIESCDYIYKIEEGQIQCVKSKDIQ